MTTYTPLPVSHPRHGILLRRTLAGVPATFALLMLSFTSSVSGQAVPAPAAPSSVAGESVVKLEAFVTTGTRFSDRTVTESPVPIDVITSRELTTGGYTETSQMLQAAVPSFNFPRATIGDGTDHIRPATLRGLAPDQVLVLVNGKRRHTSSLVNVNGTIGRGSVSVDLNAIPSSAIGRVEVLRDGASAQYGSDAIAGVINFVLDQTTGYGFDATYGVTSEGDGEVREASAFAGVPLANKGVLHTTVFWRDRENTNRSAADTRQQYFGSSATGAATAISGNFGSGTGQTSSSGTLSPKEASINRVNHRQGDGDSRDAGVFVNAEVPLTDPSGLTLYGFGGYTKRDGKAAGFFRRAGDDRTVRALWPDGFLPMINTDIEDYSIGAGLKGEDLGWDYDLSTVLGGNTLEYFISDTNNVTLGTASPRQFYAGSLQFDQWTTNFDLTKSIDVGLQAPLKTALGAEYRWENYQIGAGEPDSYRDGGVRILDGPSAGGQGAPGAQVFPGFRPSDAVDRDRKSYAVYADVENQVTERLLVSGAVRFEDYSDFGNETTFKVAGRLKLTEPLAVRASIATGFRAPHLAQSWFSSTATNFLNGVPVENKTFPVTDPVAIALGASPLKPETSKSYSVGLTYNEGPLSASIDTYFIAIDDRIVLSSNYTGTAVVNFLNSRGLFGVAGGRYFTNAVDTETKGVDLNVRYRFDLENLGKLTATVGANLNDTSVVRITSTPPQLAALGITTPIFDLTEQVRLETGQPKNTFNVGLGWDWQKLSVFLRNVRYGEVETVAFASATPAQIAALTPGFDTRLAPTVPASANSQIIQSFDPKWLTDLDVTYRLSDGITVSVGANNLFDVYPTKNLASVVVNGTVFNGSDNVGIFPYNGIAPSGFNGAFYYGKVSYRF